MNIFSILHLTLLVAMAIEESKTEDPLIDIIESEEKGRARLFCSRYTEMPYLYIIVDGSRMFKTTLNSRF